MQRAAKRFGLIAAAGELAIALEILPWEEGTALKAATACFEAWIGRPFAHGMEYFTIHAQLPVKRG